MKPKRPIFSTSITETVKNEWLRKEEGSYEDNGKPESGHIFCVLCNSPKGKIVCYTEEEKRLLSASASYHNGGWDWGESAKVDKLMKSAARICKQLISK